MDTNSPDAGLRSTGRSVIRCLDGYFVDVVLVYYCVRGVCVERGRRETDKRTSEEKATIGSSTFNGEDWRYGGESASMMYLLGRIGKLGRQKKNGKREESKQPVKGPYGEGSVGRCEEVNCCAGRVREMYTEGPGITTNIVPKA